MSPFTVSLLSTAVQILSPYITALAECSLLIPKDIVFVYSSGLIYFLMHLKIKDIGIFSLID